MNGPHAPSKPVTHVSRRTHARSVLGWAFAISLALHLITLPFFGLKAQAHEKEETYKTSIDHTPHIKPTPPPPTPPPPTPPPVKTPPRMHASASPPPSHRTIHVVRTHNAPNRSGETAYIPHENGTHDADRTGIDTSGTPGPDPLPAATASPVPTVAPPTATPKPVCADPNANAGIKGQAVEPVIPDLPKEQGASGSTEVEVALDDTGAAVSVSVHKSSGFELLDRAALAAARDTQYYPETVDCVKTAGRYLFRADFDTQ